VLFSCEQVASKLDPADKEKLEKEIDDAIKWLDDNQLAEVRSALLNVSNLSHPTFARV